MIGAAGGRAPDPGRELQAAKGKINALSAALRLGHEAFSKNSLEEWAIQVVNNSVLLIPYNRSTLIDLRGPKPKLLAVSGLSEVKQDTEFAFAWRDLGAWLAHLDKTGEVTLASLTAGGASEMVVDAFETLSKDSPAIVVVPLRLPQTEAGDNLLLWAIELDNAESAAPAMALTGLLSEHYSESLYFVLTRRRGSGVSRTLGRRRWLRPSRLLMTLGIVFLVACVVVRVPLTVSSEFSIVPAEDSTVYSPFDGIIGSCNFRSGDQVAGGDAVVVFNTEEQSFKLAAALSEYERTGALLEIAQLQSFADPTKRSQVRLLELQRRRTGVEVQRNRWFIERSVLHAEAAGTLEIGDASKLEGKAVKAGERIFEVIRTDELLALVAVDERNASVLSQDLRVTLYLHARPEEPISGRIVSISPRPVLTERKLYCYMVRVEIADRPRWLDKTALRDGLRGVAKLSGDNVSLGYYLFRNLILRYRQW